MENNTIFITGGIGNQGSAAARSLIKNGFKVKSLVRKASSPKAEELERLGVELVEGDLNHVDTYQNALQGVYGIFCVLSYHYGVEKEKKQGKQLIDVAKQYNISHFVYSSVIGSDLHTGIPHWESKLIIEDHLRQSGIPYTIIHPASLYENFLIPQVKNGILKGKLSTPVKGDVVQQFISSQDIGEISALIFLHPEKYIGQSITIAAEEMTMNQVADTFNESMGRPIKYQPLPMFLTRIFMGKDHVKMFKWVNEHNAVFVKDLNAFKKEYPNLLGLKEWVKIHFPVPSN